MKLPAVLALLAVAALLAGGTGWRLAQKSAEEHPAAHATADVVKDARKVSFYQSPMHPWIKSDKPGKCTICGMTLVPVYEGEKGGSKTTPPASRSPRAPPPSSAWRRHR